MQKFARLICFCLLVVFTTDSFAKGVNPMRHAAGSAEAQLVLESLKNRIQDKFARSSVAQREAIFNGLYKMSVKAHNKLSMLDTSVIADKFNKFQPETSQAATELSSDEEAASEFAAETLAVETNAPVSIDASQVESVLSVTGKSLADLGTPVVNGKFKALSKSDLLSKISFIDGDGDDLDGVWKALMIIIVGFFVLLAIVAVAIVGVSFAAWGVPGAIAGLAVVVIGLLILFRR